MTTTPTIWETLHQANLTDAGDQSDLAVVDIGLGRFIVAWTEQSGGPIGIAAGDDILGQIFDAEGNAIGGEFQLNVDWSVDNEDNPALASRPGGGFVMVYEDTDAFGTSIRVQVFDIDGNVVAGSPISIVDDIGADALSSPSLAVRPDGSYLVTYQRSTAAGDTDIVGKIVAADGTVGAEFDIFNPTDDSSNSDAAVLTSGNYVVVFQDENSGDGANRDPEFQIVSSAGALLAGSVIDAGADDQTDVHVAALAGGGFVAVWTEENGDGNGDGVRARIYDNDGDALDVAFIVNMPAAGSQFSPDVVGLPDGGFVVVWDDNAGGVTRGQRFDATGGKVGAEFEAGSLGVEVEPVVALLDDSRFIAGFDQVGGADTDVYTTIFDPRENLIDGTGEDDVITSRREGATVNGLGGNDTLLGQEGDDILDGGIGADEMHGRSGNDTYVVDEIGDDVNESAGAGTDQVLASVDHALAAHVENLILTAFAAQGVGNGLANQITGNGEANTLLGLAGDDALDGGLGADIMQGGEDNDTYIVDDPGDTAVENAGAGIDLVLSGVTFTLGADVENLMLTGTAADGTGNDLANFLTGNEIGNILSGLAGDDTIRGAGGNDSLFGGLGNDRLNGAAGADAAHGGAGDDIYLVDSLGDSVIENAAEGTNLVRSSVSFTLGANLEDLLLTDAGVKGKGNSLANTITGNELANALSGLAGKDSLLGEEGNDNLRGGKGMDKLVGGDGRDKLSGNGGKDAFVFDTALGGNVDKVRDFESGRDSFWLDKDIFAAIGNKLGKAELAIGKKADDGNDRLIFDEDTGRLFYDANGNAAGGKLLFARVAKGASLDHMDFVMIDDFVV